jgi:hypothetical protein
LLFRCEVHDHPGSVESRESRTRRNPMDRELYLKCSDGHYYIASLETIRWRSMHFGYTQFRRCPVDGKWRKANFVDPRTLTPAELEEAATHRV